MYHLGTGALTFAELGGLFPRVGGVYVFLKEAYNEFVAFLYGFAILLVITSGALAALARRCTIRNSSFKRIGLNGVFVFY